MSLSVSDTEAHEEIAYHRCEDGAFAPSVPVVHRDDEYDSAHLDLLLSMQEQHFWYRGRHRFLLHAVQSCLGKLMPEVRQPAAVDLGGGCGGWLKFLEKHAPQQFGELALADSSRRALELAQPLVSDATSRYHVDLNRLGWSERWDVAFLLDVLEHIPGEVHVLEEICRSLRPGGLLFVTVPALNAFWSYNDELAHHERRYSRADFLSLTQACGMEVCDSRYFMTLLSPLLLLSRLRAPKIDRMTAAEVLEHQRRTHRVPPRPINDLLTAIFCLESPMGHWVRFPWGTSCLAVLRRPWDVQTPEPAGTVSADVGAGAPGRESLEAAELEREVTSESTHKARVRDSSNAYPT